MPDEHEFFPQPRGNPPWCFCKDPHCPGWTAYVAWYQADTGGPCEPDDDVIETHRRITRTMVNLARGYSELLGAGVDFNTALDLAAIDRAAEPHG